MALIKCRECGKEISDKASTCVNCGCPILKELVCSECGYKLNENDKICKKCGCPVNNEIIEEVKNKVPNKIFTKIWLVICVLACLCISTINFMNVFNILNTSFYVGNIVINVMGVLTLLLGGAYVFLFITSSEKSFYLLLGINALILMYNFLSIGMVISLFYIILVLINSLITFLIMRKQLKKGKLKIK